LFTVVKLPCYDDVGAGDGFAVDLHRQRALHREIEVSSALQLI
jgi:hypothetical protein